MTITEEDAVNAAKAMQIAYDSATKLAAQWNDPEVVERFYPLLLTALVQGADALGYDLVKKGC